MSKIFFNSGNVPEEKQLDETTEDVISESAVATEAVGGSSFYDDDDEKNGFSEIKDKRKVKARKYQPERKAERFSPNLKEGLTPSQVAKRFEENLTNATPKKFSKSYASIFISNIFTFFNFLCLVAFIALLIAKTSGITNYLVVVITTANLSISIFQEIRAKLSIEKLSVLAVSNTKVVRDGEVCEIATTDIVLDDVIILELGNQVPVDCILAEGSVEVNESLLTGESIPIKKQAGDMLYAGSFISSGSGKFRVEKVGKDTYLEKLTGKAKQYRRPNSELMNSTNYIIRVIGMLIIPIAIGIFLVTYNNIPAVLDDNIVEGIFSREVNYALQRTCTVVIGMIPSGLILLTSMALFAGVARLAKHNTLVQDLYSLEMLARVDVLCLDKTGTITDGRMQVKDTMLLGTLGEYSIDDIMGSMLSALEDNNQTSMALANHFGHSNALSPTAKLPFSSKRKLSAVTFQDEGTYVLGAPEFVLKPMPPKVERIVKQYAQMGLRVIVLAHSTSSIVGEKLPSMLKPIAIISIADNIRDDAIQTIKWFKENDVQVKVISGDNPVTVSEVAKRAGISNADKYISLEGLNDKEVANVANKYTVFGRVTPEQKAILVRAIKRYGHTTAMTGDGVNDILALKEADCAISVASGSEAARNVSHLVLMDNNFNSMPKVVAEGRRVINNIKNSASLFLMKTLFTALLATFCILNSEPYLFLPKNVLLLEFCIIGIPSLALSLQPNNARVEGKYISHVMSRSIPGALLMFVCVLAMYLTKVFNPEEFTEYFTPMAVMALTFAGLVMLYRVCQPFNAYRLVLLTLMVTMSLLVFIFPFLTNLVYDLDKWQALTWDYSKILIIAVVIEAAFPLSACLINIMQILIPSSTGKKAMNNEEQN